MDELILDDAEIWALISHRCQLRMALKDVEARLRAGGVYMDDPLDKSNWEKKAPAN